MDLDVASMQSSMCLCRCPGPAPCREAACTRGGPLYVAVSASAAVQA